MTLAARHTRGASLPLFQDMLCVTSVVNLQVGVRLSLEDLLFVRALSPERRPPVIGRYRRPLRYGVSGLSSMCTCTGAFT